LSLAAIGFAATSALGADEDGFESGIGLPAVAAICEAVGFQGVHWPDILAR
jgi:hypothetical protein